MALLQSLGPKNNVGSVKTFSFIVFFGLLVLFTGINLLGTLNLIKASLAYLPRKNPHYLKSFPIAKASLPTLVDSQENVSIAVPDSSQSIVQSCVHPKLYEDDPAILKHVKIISPPKCEGEEWLRVVNGTVRFSITALEKYKSFTCDYYPLERTSESETTFAAPIKNITDGFKMVSDFFKGVCYSTEEMNKTNKVIYAGVHFSKERAARSIKANPLKMGFEGLSIAILGFDSMSRMSWYRRLKKTYSYFVNSLNGIELKGHNIVGDGTTAVMLPMLTGKFEWELPECRSNQKLSTTLDKFPFIWHDMKEAGYLTSWSNADPNAAAFNWRMKGFKEQPTDFYPRPFYLKMRRKKGRKKFCDGARTSSRVWLDFFRDIFLMYPEQRKFLLHFITDFSHDDNNFITMMDDDIMDLVKFLHTNNYLNNTLLILMGDHGARYPAYVRANWQGKIEERLPFFGFAFPPWFEKKYPEAMKNLRTNTERLTTPFDIHETFRDFLNFGGTGKGDLYDRGISLFKEISPARTCEMAGITPHWCACLDWKNVTADDPGVLRATKAVLDTINGYTAPYRDDCALLSLESLDMANKMEPNENLLRFQKVSVDDHNDISMSASAKNPMTRYQLMLTTTPGRGIFEVTISHDLTTDKLRINKDEISRISKYGDEPWCILEKDKSIRAYCHCKQKKT